MLRIARSLRCFSVSRQEVEKKVMDFIKTYEVDTAKLTPEADLKEIGLSDIDIVEVVASSEYMFKVDFKEEEALALKTIPEIVDLVLKHKEEGQN